MFGSVYYYSCNIKGFCSQAIHFVDNDVKEKNLIADDENMVNKKNNEENENSVINKKDGVYIVRRTLKCNKYLSKIFDKNNYSEIKKIEKFLRDYFKKDIKINGIYDNGDVELIKKFQVENNLIKNGMVDLPTLDKINQIKCIIDYYKKEGVDYKLIRDNN